MGQRLTIWSPKNKHIFYIDKNFKPAMKTVFMNFEKRCQSIDSVIVSVTVVKTNRSLESLNGRLPKRFVRSIHPVLKCKDLEHFIWKCLIKVGLN
jgi:hypothetical protein